MVVYLVKDNRSESHLPPMLRRQGSLENLLHTPNAVNLLPEGNTVMEAHPPSTGPDLLQVASSSSSSSDRGGLQSLATEGLLLPGRATDSQSPEHD